MNDREEGKGMRLLRKGKRGLIQAIFSRLGLIVLLFLLQLALLLGLFSAAAEFLPHFFGGTIVFNAIIVIYLLNSEGDPTAKLTWLVFFSVAPVFGALFYLYTKSDIGHRLLRERTTQLIREGRSDLRAHASAQQHLEERDPQIARMASYIAKTGCYPVWEHTAVTYFPLGEDKFAALLPALRQAKHFIFLEYFIVEEGEMWGQVLSILVEKVKQGVEVRVLVDGTCEFTHLTHDYPRRMQELGIKCKMFAPVRPFVSTHYNYRDHRKIAVIDGQVAFTGGVNLADEYINRVVRFGHWKDTAVMLRGEAVRSFTLMFLNMWAIDEHTMESSRFLAYPTKPVMDAPVCAALLGFSGGRQQSRRAGVYRHSLPRAAVRPHHDALPHHRPQHGDGAAIRGGARRGRPPDSPRHPRQEVRLRAGAHALRFADEGRRQNQRIYPRLRPRKSVRRG